MVTEKKTDAQFEYDNPVMAAFIKLNAELKEQPYSPFGNTARLIHGTAQEKGWYDKLDTWEDLFPEKCMMIVTEISEAVDEYRNRRSEFYFLPESAEAGKCEMYSFELDEWHGEKMHGTAVELIDALIRILDLLAFMDVDIDTILRMKMSYNTARSFRHGNKRV